MHVAVYLPLVASVLLGPSARWLAPWLPPRAGTWLIVGAGTVCAAATATSVAALAATYVGQIPLVATLGGWSATRLQHANPVPAFAAEAAVAAGAAMAVMFVLAAVRATRQTLLARRTCRRLPTSADQVVVLDDPVPDAFALAAGPRGRVVVSTGMLQALSTGECTVLLAHETAHLRHRHQWFRVLATLAAGLDPLVVGLPAAVRQLTERWADEDAVSAVGDRRLAAEAIARAALASARARRVAGALRGDGEVPRRVACLLRPRPRRGVVAVVALAGLLAVSAVSTVETGRDTDGLFDVAHLSHPVRPSLEQVAQHEANKMAHTWLHTFDV